MSHAKKTLLLTLPGGGFFWEAMQLREALAPRFNMRYVSVNDFHAPENLPFPPEELLRIRTVTTLSRSSRWQKIKGLLGSFFDSYKLFRRNKPDVLVCVGSSMSIPLAIWARIFRVPTYFVESITRVEGLSTTGLIFRRWRLARHIYVQWPHMVENNPGSEYSGSVL